MRLFVLLSTSILVTLSGCNDTLAPPRSGGSTPVTPPPSLAELPDAYSVIKAIKDDIGSYNAYQAAHENDAELPNACKGSVSFKVTSVAIELNTVGDQSTAGNVGAKVPIVGFTLGPSLESSKAFKNSIKVAWTFVPVPDEQTKALALRGQTVPGPFETALRNLRMAMLRASDQKPCFTFPPEQKNSVEALFQVTKNDSAKFGVDFLIFSTGASAENSRETSNTISISFEAVGQTFINPRTGKRENKPAYLSGKLSPGSQIFLDRDSILVLPADTDAAPDGAPKPTTK